MVSRRLLNPSCRFSSFPPATSHGFPADNFLSSFTEKAGGTGTIFLCFLPSHQQPADSHSRPLQTPLHGQKESPSSRMSQSHSPTLTLSPLVSTPPLALQSFFPGSSLSSDSSPLLCVHLWTQHRPSFPFTAKPAGSVVWAFSSDRHHCLPPPGGVWGLRDLIVASLSSVTSLHSPPVCALPAASPQLPAPRGQLLTLGRAGRAPRESRSEAGTHCPLSFQPWGTYSLHGSCHSGPSPTGALITLGHHLQAVVWVSHRL